MEAPGALSVDIQAVGDTMVVALSGELDLATADLVQETLKEAHDRRPSRLVIDCRRLTFIDSTGIGMIFREAKRDRSDCEPALELWPGPPQVQRLFHVAGILDRLPFVGVA